MLDGCQPVDRCVLRDGASDMITDPVFFMPRGFLANLSFLYDIFVAPDYLCRRDDNALKGSICSGWEPEA